MSNTEQTFDKNHALRRFEEQIAAGALACCLAALVFFVSISANQPQAAFDPVAIQAPPIAVFPDFASIDSVKVKKQQFFDYLEDYVIAENARMPKYFDTM